MNRTARQLPNQETINRAKQQFTIACAGTGTFNMVKNPTQLGARKIRINQEARALGDHLTMAGIAQTAALIGRAPILPDDCIVNGFTRGLIPNNRGFTLIGDANCGNLARRDTRISQSVIAGSKRCLPQIKRIVFDPA